MSDSTPLTCAVCERPMHRTRQSLPQGRATCHPCRRELAGLSPLPERPPRVRGLGLSCAGCGKRMVRHSKTSLPQGLATCLSCRQARAAARRTERHLTRACPMCGRSFQHNRRTYCSQFCRTVGSRVSSFRDFLRMEGEYRPARWWVRTEGDPRWTIGPPRILLDVWFTPAGDARCPECASSMTDRDAMGHECIWCGIRAIPL